MKDLLTMEELCKYLKVTRFSIYNYRKQGLPVEIMINGSPRFDLEKVIEWFKEKENREEE